MNILLHTHEIDSAWTLRYRGRDNPLLSKQEVVSLAFYFARATVNPSGANRPSTFQELQTQLRRKIIDRLPDMRQSDFCRVDNMTADLIDLIGEFSRMIIDAVVRILGAFPSSAYLIRHVGPDLLICVPH